LLEFEKKDALNGPILRAIKWIGNDGSHQGGVLREDVLDAFDMMELALTNLYDDAAAAVMKKVQAVIKSKEKKSKSKPTSSVAVTGSTLPSASTPSSQPSHRRCPVRIRTLFQLERCSGIELALALSANGLIFRHHEVHRFPFRGGVSAGLNGLAKPLFATRRCRAGRI
jgi:hypothetical protein